MTLDEVRKTWMHRLVRGSTETLDHEPSRVITTIYESTDSAAGTKYVAWSGEHIMENTPARLHRHLAAPAQPVRTHGRLSFGRYEVLKP
jgi:hypothetical protein